MTNEFICHRGTSQDIAAFLTFFRTSMPTLFPQYSPHSIGYTVDVDYGPEWLTEQLEKKDKWVYLAYDNKCVVGYLLVGKPVVGVAYADWLGVDKQYQKKGIASHLLSLWEKDVLSEGAHALFLWTYEYDIKFYKKLNFSVGGLFPKSWYGEDCYLIYKILREPEEKNFLKNYLNSLRHSRTFDKLSVNSGGRSPRLRENPD